MNKWLWFGVRVILYLPISFVIVGLFRYDIDPFRFAGKVMFYLTIMDLIIVSRIKDLKIIISWIKNYFLD